MSEQCSDSNYRGRWITTAGKYADQVRELTDEVAALRAQLAIYDAEEVRLTAEVERMRPAMNRILGYAIEKNLPYVVEQIRAAQQETTDACPTHGTQYDVTCGKCAAVDPEVNHA